MPKVLCTFRSAPHTTSTRADNIKLITETAFEMDEDMPPSSDEDASAEIDDVSIASALDMARRKSVQPRIEHSTEISSFSARKGEEALAAMLADPTSFLGSLRPSSEGSASLAYTSTGPAYLKLPGSSNRDLKKADQEAVSLNEQAMRLRDILAMDAPSHRGRRSKSKQIIPAFVNDAREEEGERKYYVSFSYCKTFCIELI